MFKILLVVCLLGLRFGLEAPADSTYDCADDDNCATCDTTDATKCHTCATNYSLVVDSTAMLGDGTDGAGEAIDDSAPTSCVLTTACTGATGDLGFPITGTDGRLFCFAAACSTTCALTKCVGFATTDCTECADATSILVKATSSADTIFACVPTTTGCVSGYLVGTTCSPTICSGTTIIAHGTSYSSVSLGSFTCSADECEDGEFEWESSLGITFCLSSGIL